MTIEGVLNEVERRFRNPLVIYAAAKALDNAPGIVGTRSLAADRAMTFYCLRTFRQFFYEPLRDFDLIRDVALNNIRLDDAYAPRYLLDHVLLELRVFPSARTAPGGHLPMPSEGEQAVGRAVYLAGLDHGGESLGFLNSWGRAWGINGTGTISRQYWDAFGIEAWLTRYARWGPSAMTWDRLTQAADDREYAKAWGLENPRWRRRVRIDGRPHQLCLWETISWTGCIAEVVELRDGRGFRIGWAELFHGKDGEQRVTFVKELFVWPRMRRRGYGTVLLSWAEERARAMWSTATVVSFYDFDAIGQARTAGRTLLQRAGYDIRWRPRSEPTLAGRGYKQI
jgi:GNAT superfamily N-acetyltransferase